MEFANDKKNKWKILVIDDEDMICQFVEMALEGLNGEVRTARNGSLGLQMAREFRPDLIISDILMPEMMGDAMAVRLQNELPDLNPRIIFMSGYCDLSKEQVRDLGGDQIIAKPFSVLQLVKMVKEVLDISD